MSTVGPALLDTTVFTNTCRTVTAQRCRPRSLAQPVETAMPVAARRNASERGPLTPPRPWFQRTQGLTLALTPTDPRVPAENPSVGLNSGESRPLRNIGTKSHAKANATTFVLETLRWPVRDAQVPNGG